MNAPASAANGAERQAPKSVLFMCRMNAVRSPMAEALARAMLPKGTYVASAGVRPGERDPFVDAVLQEIDLTLGRHLPHTLEDLEDDYFDLIVTLAPLQIAMFMIAQLVGVSIALIIVGILFPSPETQAAISSLQP